MYMLFVLILSILMLSVFMIIFGDFGQKKIQSISLFSMVICFLVSIFFWVFFDRTCSKYQFVLQKMYICDIVFDNNVDFLLFYVNKFIVSFGVDGISIFFIILATFISPMCVLTSWKFYFLQIKEYCIYFILLEIFLILSFSSMDLIFFFVFFESILIPMFFIVGVWGSRERRIMAAFLFFLYTLVGSIFLFFSILVLYYDVGSTNFCVLTKISVNIEKQLILWIFIYLSFSVKIPSIPLHNWLPEAHVEAPTSGSVILAGLLLKLGGYGFIRVLIPLFPEANVYYLPFADTIAVISIVYASLTTIRQIDLKRIIAYSSIAHMNLVVLGIFSWNIQSVSGSIFLMVAHGIVSSALFFLIGVLYDKYGTRLICYYGGLIQTMPIFSTQMMFFCLANIGLPGTCNFIGELVVFAGLVEQNIFVLIIATTSVVFSVLYTMFFFNRLVFGNLNLNYISIYKDITKREYSLIIPLTVLTIILGVFPDLVFDTILTSVSMVVEFGKLV